MSRVTFTHGHSEEQQYLLGLLKEKEWFRRNHFQVFLSRDPGDTKNRLSKREELLKAKVVRLRSRWKKIEHAYLSIVKTFRHKKILPHYRCHVSRFGPEGKYRRPNFLFVRLRTKSDERRVIETVGHELLHLLFADFFNAKKLKYAEREGTVDALILKSDLVKLFPSYQKQSIGKVRRPLVKSILGYIPRTL